MPPTYLSRRPTPSRCKSRVSTGKTALRCATGIEFNIFVPTRIDLDAGKAFEKAAEVFTKNLNEPDDAANSLIDAFKAYRKTDPQSAVRCVKVAIQRYCAKGNFRRAASQQEALAEVYEQELNDPKSALEACESAASWYEGDNATA